MGGNLKVLIVSVDMLFAQELISRMLSKPGRKAHFAKIMVIRWVFVEILSRDVVTSADFTIVGCKKKCCKVFFAP